MNVYFENGLTVIDTNSSTENITNTSGKVGVCWYKHLQAYRARIRFNYKDYTLIFSKNFDEAVAIRKEAEKHRANGDFLEWFETLQTKKPTKGK